MTPVRRFSPVLTRIGTTVLLEAIRSSGLLLAVSFGMFALLTMAPGDPVSMYVNVQSLSPEEVEAVRHELGLDRSFPVRYGAWLSRMVRGDLGTSLRSGRPVAQDLWETGWRTLLLTGSAMALTLLFSAVTAYLSATERHPRWASALSAAGYALSGVPVYWLGYVVIYVATTRFDVFPVMSGTSTSSTSGAWMFLVPVGVLGLGNGTVSEVTRHLRGHLETVLTEDYIRTARAKGARLWRHLYKDGFVMPLSSLVASKTPYMLGGAVIVEQVFNWPGMGRLAWQAALDRDYPVLLGITLVAALVIRAGHMLKEAAQVAVNPQLAA